ncbi:MAG: winged helix-turn-helix domain-containing protein [Prevotella sp.]|nr:winged helix-turn-helix domain-containing protein [Prevotella sp.]
MAEKKTATATTKTAATTKAAVKAAPVKKACATKKACTTKTAKTVDMTVENIGFRAGDVYQTLASEAQPMTVAQIAKNAKISEIEVLMGAGWLMKEGKVCAAADKLVLA